MGVVRTVKGDDGRPYISIEDLIIEVKDVKNSSIVVENSTPGKPNFVDIVLKTLVDMEREYYDKYLFKNDKE